MLDTFTKQDLLMGMSLLLRNGTSVHPTFVHCFPYTDDLKYAGEAPLPLPGNPTGPKADVMQVLIGRSGTVLWERKEESLGMTCIGCNRDEPMKRDEICCSCLRGGHETDVDFYSPDPGGMTNEKG